jgi:acyl-coenzyme A thioesterase PaaI-like protein
MTEDRAVSYRRTMAVAADPPPEAAAAGRLGDALRHLARVVAGSSAGDDLLDEAAAGVLRLADGLEGHRQASRYPQGLRLGGPSGAFLTHPIIGITNPVAPPVAILVEAEEMVGRAVYGPAFEGPPGYVHGGHIAAAFDVILAATAGINGVGGLTKSLSVRYRKPAPMHTELVYRGGVEEVTERTTVVRGTLHAGEVLCAEAVGHFAYRAVLPAP